MGENKTESEVKNTMDALVIIGDICEKWREGKPVRITALVRPRKYYEGDKCSITDDETHKFTVSGDNGEENIQKISELLINYWATREITVTTVVSVPEKAPV